jgi:hypothetical protein
MTYIKQQKSNGLFKGSFVQIVSATSQQELIRGPYTSVQHFQTSNFGGIIDNRS